MSGRRRIFMTTRRLEKGFSQLDLAKKCGVSNKTISSIELGTKSPSGQLAWKLSRILEVDMELFFKDSISA